MSVRTEDCKAKIAEWAKINLPMEPDTWETKNWKRVEKRKVGEYTLRTFESKTDEPLLVNVMADDTKIVDVYSDDEDSDEDKFGDNSSDFYFQLVLPGTIKGDESGTEYFLITPKVYFDNHGYLFDSDMPLLEAKIDQHGFQRLMESAFEFVPNWNGSPNYTTGNPQQGRSLLLSLGFIEKKMV